VQLALAYDAGSSSAADWTEIENWFRKAVGVVGEKEVAFRLDVKASNLSDALLSRERKEIKARWISAVLRMCPEVLVREYLDIVSRQHGFEEPKRKRIKTAEEMNRERDAWLEQNAPAVLAMMRKDVG
jgi:hypothetical protein